MPRPWPPWWRGSRPSDSSRASTAAPEPPAPEPVREPEPIRGDYGTAVSRRTVKKCQVEDYDVAYIHVSKNTKVREAIDKAIAAQVRSGVEEIPGVRIWDDVAVSNR